MHPLIKNEDPPGNLIDRKNEIKLIETAIEALLYKKSLLSTPVIDFFGIDGMGKTRLFQHISALCMEKKLLCIELNEKQTQLNEKQNVSRIARLLLQQAKKYGQDTKRKSTNRKGGAQAQTIAAIKALLESESVVILLDSIDTSNEPLVNWIETTLRDLLEHNNLLVVLTSKQKIVFEHDWSVARKVTPFQLKPFNQDDSREYLTTLNKSIVPKTREVIWQWTRGYPLAMEAMTSAIIQHRFDVQRHEDQQRLITIIIEEVIDKKVLKRLEPSRLEWCKAHLLLLSIPRRFNLVIMQDLLETFGKPPIEKTKSKLEYMGLPRELNANADILDWDMQKAGFTIDESIRNLFFIYLRLHDFHEFRDINEFLAQKNQALAIEVSGSDSVRYFRECLYHSAQYSDAQAIEEVLLLTLQQISNISSDAMVRFREEFKHDRELQEILGKPPEYVYSLIEEHLPQEE